MSYFEQTELITSKTILGATGSDNTDATLVSAGGAGIITYVVAMYLCNNETTESNDEKVFLRDGSGGTILYGDASGGIYLPGRGGVFPLLQQSPVLIPFFATSANTALYMDLTNAREIAWAVWYYQE